MTRALLIALMLAGCTNVLRGESGFTAGRATIVPCDDKPGALIVVEGIESCWQASLGERLSCDQWRQFVTDSPQVCGDEVVFDSPSASTLTGYFDEPIDRDFLLGSATTRMFDLPCNPRGPGADYEDFEEFLSVYSGDVRVTKDKGFSVKVEVELYPTDASTGDPVFGEPALEGTVNAQVCR